VLVHDPATRKLTVAPARTVATVRPVAFKSTRSKLALRPSAL
jgi:hypothetical protein